MAAIDHSLASFHFVGDDLVPSELTALLGTAPTEAHAKGDGITSTSGTTRLARTGHWTLTAERREPEDLEGQVFEILDRLPSNLHIWEQLAKFQPHFFCGIFMGSGNDGMDLSPKLLLALGQRGISLGFDIYDAHD